MGKAKRVVVLIVVGMSDEALLYERLRDLFRQHNIKVEVIHGDVFFDKNRREKPIKKTIGDIVRDVLRKRRFKSENILSVVHILDMDGCFISDDRIEIDESIEGTIRYELDCIKVPDKRRKESISRRNMVRSRNVQTMNSLNRIKGRQFHISCITFREPWNICCLMKIIQQMTRSIQMLNVF